jgi:outer membrane biosynthesis protein TonB
MRLLALALIVMAYATVRQIHAAEPRPPTETRAGWPMPPNQMHASGHSSECDVPPKFIWGLAPIYPTSRLRLRHAEIRFTVDGTGHTGDYEVLTTNSPYFASRSILAMRGWRFQPGTKHGRPVSCHLVVPFTSSSGR